MTKQKGVTALDWLQIEKSDSHSRESSIRQDTMKRKLKMLVSADGDVVVEVVWCRYTMMTKIMKQGNARG